MTFSSQPDIPVSRKATFTHEDYKLIPLYLILSMKRAISVDKTVSNQFLSTESGLFVDKIHQGAF